MAVTLDKSTLVEKLEELAAIDEKIAQIRGDEKVLKAQAETDLLQAPAETSPIMDVEDVGDPTFDLGLGTFGDVFEAVQSVQSWLEQAQSWLDQQVNEYVKATRDASKDDITALTEARATTANMAEALRTILLGSGITDLPEVPKAKNKAGGASSSTRTVKVSGARFYRVLNGDRTDQPDSQNTLSSLVYYQSHHFSEDGKRMTTDDFVSLAKAMDVDVKQATPWSLTNTNKDGSVTVGMDVIPAE